MFVPEGFTHQGRQVVMTARTDAGLLQHDHVSTEHLLLGLLSVAGTRAETVLTEFGLTRDAMLEGLRGSGIGWTGGEAQSDGVVAFTPQVREVLELAQREALLRGSEAVGPEHLLLAVIREGQGVAAQLIAQTGSTRDTVRRRLLEVMGEDAGGERPRADVPDSLDAAGRGATNIGAASSAALGGGVEAQRIVGRDREIDRLARILSRRHDPHALVLGEPGVGKTALIRGLIWEATEGRLRGLPLGRRPVRWVSAPDREASEQRSGLVVVDDARLANDRVGLLEWVAGLPGPAVVTMSSRGAFSPVSRERELIGRFGVVELAVPDRAAALAMVRAACADLERHYQVVSFTDAAIVRAVDAGGTLPDSAVRLLDDAAALALVTSVAPRAVDVAEVEAALADPALAIGAAPR